jgi:hypothetical protein
MNGSPVQPTEKILVGPREAARMLDISPRSLWKLTFTTKEIPCIKVGALTKYRPQDLEAWAERMATGISHNCA